jgi:hypothetical protein
MTSEERSCQCKVRHRSASAALLGLNVTRRVHKLQRWELEIYACRFCKGWHVGNCKSVREPIRRMVRK